MCPKQPTNLKLLILHYCFCLYVERLMPDLSVAVMQQLWRNWNKECRTVQACEATVWKIKFPSFTKKITFKWTNHSWVALCCFPTFLAIFTVLSRQIIMKYGKNEVPRKECLASHKLLDSMLLVCAEVWSTLSTVPKTKSHTNIKTSFQYSKYLLFCLKGQIHMASEGFLDLSFCFPYSPPALGCVTLPWILNSKDREKEA